MSRKLTPEDARMIRALVNESRSLRDLSKHHRQQARRYMEQAMNLTHERIAEKFDIGVGTVDCIAIGRRWGDV